MRIASLTSLPVRILPPRNLAASSMRILVSRALTARLLPLLVSLAIVASLFVARPAFAEDKPDAPIAYGVMAGELSIFGVFAGNFGKVWSSNGPAIALNFTPIVLIPAAGFAAHYGGLDVRPALAIHGGAWYGVTGLMIGALIDGRAKRWQMKTGVFAWSLGAAGAIAGGLLGATSVETKDAGSIWMAAPPIGFVGGGLVLGGLLVLVGGLDGDDSIGQFSTGAIVGTALGLGVATWFAFHDQHDAVARVTPTVTGPALSGDDATIFSFGGAW